MKNLLQSILTAVFLAALILAAYFADLVLCGLSRPQIVEALPCYMNAFGRLAVRTINHINAAAETETASN